MGSARWPVVFLLASSSLALACIFQQVAVESPAAPAAAPRRVINGSVKAHLTDGTTILFRDQAVVDGGMVQGRGERYDLRLRPAGTTSGIALDSLVALESFSTRVRPAETFLASTFALAAGALAVGAVAVAIACAMDPKCFGSCPTAYSDSAGTAVLEAEGFSFSIAPLFELRDVDRLRARPDRDGVLRLQVRNEALETHFINHIELLAVTHGPREVAVPDPRGAPLVLRDLRPPLEAVDRAGRDVRAPLLAHDGVFFTTDSATLWRATGTDPLDYVDLTLPPTGDDSVAILFRMRNSLLNTTLLYDLMLGDRGTAAFGWMTDGLASIGGAVSLGEWAMNRLGMQVSVPVGREFHPVGRIGDSGPVAWKDVAIVVPAPRHEPARVRLSFPADAWRIDRIAAGAFRRPEAVIVPLTEVRDAAGEVSPGMLSALAAPDTRYVETSASDHFTAFFRTGTDTAGTTTWFLAWQGYYIEWMRRAWLTQDREMTPFVPGDAAMSDALHRYRSTRDSTERRFYATRVPLR